jgi:hypothetical protein
MSVRERRNRKDRRAQTPEQVQRDYQRHAQTYGELAGGLHESDLPLNPAGYLAGIRVIVSGPAFDGSDDE